MKYHKALDFVFYTDFDILLLFLLLSDYSHGNQSHSNGKKQVLHRPISSEVSKSLLLPLLGTGLLLQQQ